MAGIALRWVTWRAYRPALLFPDSVGYLAGALTGELNVRRPSGYSLPISPFVRSGDLAMIPLAQHLLILAVAVLLYAFLLRRGVPAWGAALACVPLVLDPLQLVLEQYVLSDVLFEVLLVLACILLLWRRRPLLVAVVAAGALLGYAAIVRGVGIGLVVPAAVAVASLRLGWRRVAALVIAFALPVVGYLAIFDSQHGVFATNTYSSRYLYARVTAFVHCQGGLNLPDYERPLCPKRAVGERHSIIWYIWRPNSPQRHLKTPPDVSTIEALHDFDKRVIRAQPVAFARTIARDFAYGFHPSRRHSVPGFPASYWLFHPKYWSLETFSKIGKHLKPYGPLVAERPYSRFLTKYQTIFHIPGPLLLLAALVGAVASLGFGRARWSGNRVACGLLGSACIVPMLTAAALSSFSWRYQLPQLGLLAPAGALGLTALVRRSSSAPPDVAPTTLRRMTMSVLRRSAPDNVSATTETLVGVATAVLAGVLVAAAAFASRWAVLGTAGVLGVMAAVATLILLFTSRWRGVPASLPVGSENHWAGTATQD